MINYLRITLFGLLWTSSYLVLAENSDTVNLLRNDNISQIERSLNTIQSKFEKGELTEYELRQAYRPFYTLDPISEKNLRKWATTNTKSYPAHLALGIFLKRRGLDARGQKAISDTPQNQIDTMNYFLNLSERELVTSLKLTTKPYLSIFHLLEITANIGDQQKLKKQMLMGNSYLPQNSLVRNRYTYSSVPRWGGSYKKVDDFIAQSMQEKLPDTVIWQLQAIKLDNVGHDLADQGNQKKANEAFNKALQLAQKVGGTFSTDFLSTSRYHLCNGSNKSPYCN